MKELLKKSWIKKNFWIRRGKINNFEADNFEEKVVTAQIVEGYPSLNLSMKIWGSLPNVWRIENVFLHSERRIIKLLPHALAYQTQIHQILQHYALITPIIRVLVLFLSYIIIILNFPIRKRLRPFNSHSKVSKSKNTQNFPSKEKDILIRKTFAE